MKKILLIISLCLISFYNFSQTWEWVHRQVRTSTDNNGVYVNDVTVDDNDNIISVGYYIGTSTDVINFDGITFPGYGVGVFHYNGVVAKYNSSGTIQWVQRMGSGPTNGDVQVNGITCDASGNIFAVGSFTRTARFGGLLTSDSGGVTKTSVYSNDGFIIKYDSDGVFQWIVVIAADATIQGSKSVEGIKVTDNAIYVVGTYDKKIDFGSGITLTSTMDGAFYTNDIFVAKYDLNGTCLWARSAGGNKTDYGYGIAVDASENIFIAGYFQSTATFGSYSLTVGSGFGSTNSNSYIAKYNSLGICQWAKEGNSVSSLGNKHEQIAIDDNNDLYLSGYLSASASINFGTTVTNPSASVSSMFITKITNAGTLSWTKQYTSTGGFAINIGGISTYGSSVFVGGVLTGIGDFGSYDLTPPGWSTGLFVLQLNNTNGEVTASNMAGGFSVSNYEPYLYNNSSGDLIVGGKAWGVGATMNFSTNTITLLRSSGYVAKMSFCIPSTPPTSATADPTAVCSGVATDITLTASGGTLGDGAVTQWYTGSCGGTFVGTGNPLTVSQTLSSATTYYARYSGDCGTTTCANTTVNINTDVSITSATATASPICSSETTTVTANGVAGTNAVITWYTGTGGTGTDLGNDNPLTVGPGTYYARVTGDCGAPVETSVTVSAKTDVSITSATATASPICSSETTTVTANGVAGTNAVITWYTGTGGTGTNLGNDNPLTVGPGTYYARVTGDCGAPVEASVTVSAKTDVSITSATATASPICSSETTTVTANGVAGTNAVITWYTGTGGTGTNLGNDNPLTVGPGTYYARVTGDCGAPVEASVTVSAKTDVSITSATATASPICSSETTTITANGVAGTNAVITWFTGTGGTGTNLGNDNPLTVGPGTYYARVTGDCGGPVEASVTVSAKTDVSITSATATASPICSSETTTVTANGVAGTNAVITWFTGTGGTGTNLGNDNPLTVGPGTYYARVTGDCGGPVEASVTVSAKTDVSITSATATASPICSSETTTVTANGVAGTNAVITWYTGTGGTGTNLGNDNPLTVGPGTYYARVTGDCGAPVEASVTVSAKTDVSITSATATASPICSSETTTITANGVAGTNAVITWFTGTGGTGTNLGNDNPLTVGPGTYYARVTGDCGGPVEASVTVSAKTDVSITSATATASPICSSETTTVTANGVAGTNAVITWFTGTGGTGTNLGNDNPLTVGPGTYYARVTGDCGGPVEASVTVSAKTDVSITSATATASPICSSETTTVTANGVAGTNAVITWFTGTGGTGTNLGNDNPLTVGPGTYYARVTGDCGGPVEASVTVVETALPTAPTFAASDNNDFCEDDPGTINLSATGGSGDDVHWFDDFCGGNEIGIGNPLNIASPTVSTTYFARWENSCGESSCFQTTVNVVVPPVMPDEALANINDFCADDAGNIELSVNGGVGEDVHWFTGSCGGSSIGIGNPLIIPSPETSVTYYARWENACGETNCVNLTVKVNALPVEPDDAIVDRNDICADDTGDISLSVTGGGGDDVHWYTVDCGDTPVGTGNPLVIASPEVTTTYFARWENSCGESSCKSVVVNVIDLPTAPTFASSTGDNLCTDDPGTIDLSAVGGSGDNVRWFTGSCGGTDIGTTNPLTINSPTETTEYFVRWENACGNTACQSVVVNIIDAPTDPTSAEVNPVSVCEDDAGNISLTLVGGAGPEVRWYSGSCGGTLVGIGNPLSIESPTVNTTYYGRYESSCGNSACESVSITVTTIPVAPTEALVNINDICADDAGDISLSVNGGSGDDVHWYTVACGDSPVGIGNPLIIESPTTTTIYYGRWENSCGESPCESVQVNVLDLPTAPTFASSTGDNLCTDDSGIIDLSAVGGSGDNVRWFTGSCGGTDIGTTNPLTIDSPTETTEYFVRWENACGNTACQSVVVNIIDAPADPTSAEVNPASICEDDAGNISLTLVGGAGPEVRWYSGSCGGTLVGIGNPLSIESPTVNTTYYGRYESSCGNSACESVSITVTTIPVAPTEALVNINDICADDAGDISLSVNGGSGDDVHWYTVACGDSPVGIGNPLIIESPTTTTTYFARWENACGVTVCQNIIVNIIPVADATITPAGPFCETDDPVVIIAASSGGTWSGTGINETTGLFDPEVAGVGDHIITYTIAGGCGDYDQITISVIDNFDATITPVDPLCSNDSEITLTAATTGGTWSGTGITDANAGTFDPSVAGEGNHTITYELTGSCGDSDDIVIVVNPVANATITPAGPFCATDDPVALTAAQIGGTWSGTGITNASAGLFDPEVAGVGNHIITYTIAGDCGNSDQITISVIDNFDATITPVDPLCSNDVAITLTAASTGGTWSGTGITDANAGTFDPSVAGEGNHTITYELTGSCGDSDDIVIVVNPAADATITPAGPFCATDEIVALTAATSGGTWSGIGITNASAGLFDPEVAGVGDHIITYTISGNCGNYDQITISVIDNFDATITPVDPLCSNEAAITLTAASAGGTWSGTGITDANAGTFDPSVAGEGNHTITYELTGSCGDSDDIVIVVNPVADATITPAGPFCATDDPVALTAAQAGGTWSGIGITNASAGLFDPEVAGVGDHIITYTIAGDCGDSDQITISVIDNFDATITPVDPLCSNEAAITLTAASAGGTWSGTGITDANAGTFDPSVAGEGNHTITYELTGSCGDSDDIVIVVNLAADASITPAGPFCATDEIVALTAATTGGTWSGTGITNASAGLFDPEVAGVGNHTITYTVSGDCGDSDQITISVIDNFDADITSSTDFCFSDSDITLSAIPLGGTWQGDGVEPLTGVLNIADAGIGTHQIIYYQSGTCGGADTVYITIYPQADASIYPVDSLYENDDPITVETTENGGLWTGTGINDEGIFNPAISGIGEFEVFYTISGICGDTDSIIIYVLQNPIADLFIPNALTPDADGHNDTWRIQGIEAFDNVSIKIFTRWGDEVFIFDGTGLQYANPLNQWDGKRNDKELPSGSYVYILILNNDDTYKGTITLIR